MKTLFDKIWEEHKVFSVPDGPDVLYIDKHLIHEVTSPQAFEGLRQRGLPLFRPGRTIATADHNVPTLNQHLPIADPVSRHQVEQLEKNCEEYGIEYYGLGHPNQGIVHVMAPEMGYTLPGMTIVCGDSHTSTHGAFGTIAFGIGTSEVEKVFATQCLMQEKPRQMQINVDGELEKNVTAKDLILYIISKLTSAGATGYFIEYTGEAIAKLSMEGRMTICNMSIEMGAKGGLIAADETTFGYLQDKPFAPKGEKWNNAVAYWKTLKSDSDAKYDMTYEFNAADVKPFLTYGTNPGMGMPVSAAISNLNSESGKKALNYMGFVEGECLLQKRIDWVFIGSCTNARIEDLRIVAEFVKGKQKATWVKAYIVPGSNQVLKLAKKEGIDKVLSNAGFELREPGCSACLAMNEDKIPEGEYCVSTSNRNFEGRQGQGARTILASPLTAAAAAVYGRIVDVNELN